MLPPSQNQTAPAASLASGEPQPAVHPARSPDHTICRFELTRVVGDIESQPARTVIGSVFNDLLRLLECLGVIEKHLREVNDAEESFAFFQIIHDEARVLIDFIRKDGLSCKSIDEELLDTLDGITFAVNHDLQRVFEADQVSALAHKPAHLVIGKLYRAHDILTNCLQQSTITLAMTFDKNLVGAKLFDNSNIRYRQSLQLYNDLSALLQLAEAWERKTPLALQNLMTGVEKFRSDSLELLMYSDWPQFESFCERLKLAGISHDELEAVVHQFRCYLETLVGQVKMRSVLSEVFPIQFGADAPTFSAPPDLQDGDSDWDEFAVAV